MQPPSAVAGTFKPKSAPDSTSQPPQTTCPSSFERKDEAADQAYQLFCQEVVSGIARTRISPPPATGFELSEVESKFLHNLAIGALEEPEFLRMCQLYLNDSEQAHQYILFSASRPYPQLVKDVIAFFNNNLKSFHERFKSLNQSTQDPSTHAQHDAKEKPMTTITSFHSFLVEVTILFFQRHLGSSLFCSFEEAPNIYKAMLEKLLSDVVVAHKETIEALSKEQARYLHDLTDKIYQKNEVLLLCSEINQLSPTHRELLHRFFENKFHLSPEAQNDPDFMAWVNGLRSIDLNEHPEVQRSLTSGRVIDKLSEIYHAEVVRSTSGKQVP